MPIDPSAANQSRFREARQGNIGAAGDVLNLLFDVSDKDAMFDSLGLGVDSRWADSARRGENYLGGASRTGALLTSNLGAQQAQTANQARDAQAALFAQMQAQRAGPSVSDMQARQALGQNMQAALGAGGGRGAMLAARGAGAGIAGDSGAARLAEQLRLAQAAGGQAAGVRGADAAISRSVAGNMQSAQQQAVRQQQMYASLGRQLAEAQSRAALENYKTRRAMALGQMNTNLGGATKTAGMLASMFGAGG